MRALPYTIIGISCGSIITEYSWCRLKGNDANQEPCLNRCHHFPPLLSERPTNNVSQETLESGKLFLIA